MGGAKRIEISKRRTILSDSDVDYEELEKRVESLAALMKDTEDLKEAEAIQERITRLQSAVAVVRIGGATEIEVTEKKHRVEDALEAVRSAQDEGIVGGGGTALLRASQDLVVSSSDPHGDQSYGVSIVVNACRAPITQMALNAGLSPDIIIEKVLSSEHGDGWDFRNNRLTGMIESGIIDPVKVTKTALQNASSCAGTLLTTNYGIIQTETE